MLIFLYPSTTVKKIYLHVLNGRKNSIKYTMDICIKQLFCCLYKIIHRKEKNYLFKNISTEINMINILNDTSISNHQINL